MTGDRLVEPMPLTELDHDCRQLLEEMHVPVDAIHYAGGGGSTPDDEVVVQLWVPLLSRPIQVPVRRNDRGWRADRRGYLRQRIRAALRTALGT
jgi:hypothetical protein